MEGAGDLIRLHPTDTVAVCRRPVTAGEHLCYDRGSVTALEPIAQGHKIALRRHLPGEPVVKYGHPIGAAICEIDTGRHVHVHNLRTIRGRPASGPWPSPFAA